MKNLARILAIPALILGAFFSSTVRAEVLVITAERLFDAKSGEITGPAAVVVRDGLIAVPGNPLEEITVMEDVQFVMRQGTVCRAP